MNNRKKVVIPIIIITIVILLFGSTFAYWRWQTQRNEEVNIALTFSGSSDDLYAIINGGEPIVSTEVTLLPTNNCLGNTTLQRNVSITYKNATSQKAKIEAQMDVTIFNLRQNNLTLTNEDLSHIHWAVTTSASSCSTDVVSFGTFQGITFSNGSISNMTNDPTYGNIYNLNNGNSMITIKVPANTNNEVTTSNYYVYVWIDEDYAHTNYGNTNTDPMSEFNLQLTWHGKIYQTPPKPNPPDVVYGLVPVKLSDSGDTVTAVSENDSTWYNYDQKKWANAVLVTNDGTKGVGTTRNYYLTHPGEPIAEADILAYYVWIPRYSYKVWQYSGVSATGQEQTIEIKFIDTDTIETATQNGQWYTHPAFWWDDDSDGVRDSGEELSGIWVGKFEPSHVTLSSSTTPNNLGTDDGDTICNSTGCANYTGLRILPNVQTLRYNRISNFFNASRFMETNGNPFGLVASNIDSHMMKNSEWGAVAYLSHSKYGIKEEVRINNNSNFITGCGADTANAEGSTTCSNQYGTEMVYPQSTTGNVTGIFDMSGREHKHVMGHYGTTSTYGNNSGFSSSYPLPASKYYDNYSITSANSCTLATCGGHALNETKSWYLDDAYFVNSNLPWFDRGGNYARGSQVGIFESGRGNGSSNDYRSFRLVLIKNIESR